MKISRVVFLHSYAAYKGIPTDEGVEFLRRFGVHVEQYAPAAGVSLSAQPPLPRVPAGRSAQ